MPLRWIIHLHRRVLSSLPPSAVMVACSLLSSAQSAPTPRGQGTSVRPLTPLPSAAPGFTLLPPSVTGVTFTNILRGDAALTNAVAHNGSGVALGDVDGDGWTDLFLCGLQGPNQWFRNLGNWRFEPRPTGEASCPDQLSSGAVLVDVDGDTDLDLLVNGVGTGTRLFLNDGRGQFTEKRDSGLSRTASATSLALADIDRDGDLDLYVTHYIDVMVLSDPTTRIVTAKQADGRTVVTRVNDQPADKPPWAGRFELDAQGRIQERPEVDGLYRNDGQGRFTPIQFEPGVFQDENGRPLPPVRCWGLSAMFRDLNHDGAPDLYVCNDNASPDQLWLNNGNGTFRRLGSDSLRHGSRASMGVDFADLDRDGYDDFLVVDMLARDHGRRMRQLVRSVPSAAERERMEQAPLFNRNTLFLGRPGLRFDETALLSGIAASDWSWCPVFLDVDLDGYEDLLISNGFEQDVMDQDSTDQIAMRRWTPEQVRRYRGLHPNAHTPNAAFRNRGDATFEPMNAAWGFDEVGVSQGMATADLDGDGDLDVVVNNLNGAAGIYRNNAPAPRLAVRLRGTAPNTAAIGAQLRVRNGPVLQSQHVIAGGRYLSGDDGLRVFAAGSPSSGGLQLEVTWPNGRLTTLSNLPPNSLCEVRQDDVPSIVPPPPAPPAKTWFEDATSALAGHAHVENDFDDRSRQPLLPLRQSRWGPGLAWIDFNNDGWEDLIVSGARDGKPAVFANTGNGAFRLLQGSDKAPVDHEAVVGWTDATGAPKFLMTLSNFELSAGSEAMLKVYSARSGAVRLPAGPTQPGPLAIADVDGDGDLDLFLGGRSLPGRFPEPASSQLWLAEGPELRPSPEASRPFSELGQVHGAVFADANGDGAQDLFLALHWGSPRYFQNQSGRFVDRSVDSGLASHTGLWTSVAVGDFDEDGTPDLVAGNWGRNSAYELFRADRLGIFYGDWNGDGSVQIVEAWRTGTNWFPLLNRTQLLPILPDLTTRFPTHAAFGSATVAEILGPRSSTARRLEITELESAVFLNRGGRFVRVPLPRAAQLAPTLSVSVGDLDGDGHDDLFLAQNFLGTTSEITREDNGRGLCLRGRGDGSFESIDASLSGLLLEGEQRSAALGDYDHDGRLDLAVGQNNGRTRLFLNRVARPGFRVVLRGPASNPTATGARLRVTYANHRPGPLRTLTAGSGSLSQDSLTPVLGLAAIPKSIELRWPDGIEQSVAIPKDPTEVRIEHP